MGFGQSIEEIKTECKIIILQCKNGNFSNIDYIIKNKKLLNPEILKKILIIAVKNKHGYSVIEKLIKEEGFDIESVDEYG